VPAKPKAAPRVPRARRLTRRKPRSTRVSPGEYDRIIAILDERGEILNALRQGLAQLKQVSDVQFRRIAQIQADLDEVKLAWDRIKPRS